jgi:hypothetical protein
MYGRIRNWILVTVGIALIGSIGLPGAAWACPFCSATAQTFTEEMSTMDVVVIARLVEPPAAKADAAGSEIPKARFEITKVLKGEGLVKPKQSVETLYFGDGTKGKAFLVMGINPPNVMWSTPLPLSNRAQDYLEKIVSLPKDGAERYVFFQGYLEDDDEMLARDAYDEFAKASYDTVKSLKKHLVHDQLVAWIKNADIPASRRRLYFVMLGVCGDEKDLPMLEEMINSTDRKQRQGLDALIGCYLTLKGEGGLPMIEDAFLKNKKSDYADTYAVIMALRFHVTDGKVIEKKRVIDSLRLMLQRPELADLVIPDLARWEDWSAMDKLFELYKNADEKTSWVRVPVVNYLRACPLPKAKELLKQCEKIDPQSVKRANTFFPSPSPTPTPSAEKATRSETPGTAARYVSTSADAVPVAYEAPVPEADDATRRDVPPVAQTPSAQNAPANKGIVAAVNPGASPAKALRASPIPRPNLWQLLGVPILAGAALWFVQWSILHRRMGRD